MTAKVVMRLPPPAEKIADASTFPLVAEPAYIAVVPLSYPSAWISSIVVVVPLLECAMIPPAHPAAQPATNEALESAAVP